MVSLISAIILAAGESKRMGKPKQLLALGWGTIIEHTIDNVLNSKVSEVVVVVGHRAEETINLIASKPVIVAINPAYRQGMSTSISAGLSLISKKSQGVMLALADQPFIDSHTLNRLMEAFSAHNKGIAIPVYQGRRGHPVIFARKYEEELLALKGDIGGRQIIAQHPDDILEMTADCEGVITDIDTVDSYHLERTKLIQRMLGR